MSGKRIVDLGCQLGAMVIEAYRRGARKVTGIEYEKDYVMCSRDLCRANGFNINIIEGDLNVPEKIISYLNSYYQDQSIDILFALALYKHIKDNLWILLDRLNWKVCYLESHNAPELRQNAHVQLMERKFEEMHCNVDCLGVVEDRSPRIIWRLTR